MALEDDVLAAAGLLLPQSDGTGPAAPPASAYEAQPLPSLPWRDFQLRLAEEQQFGEGGGGAWAVLDVRREGDEEPCEEGSAVWVHVFGWCRKPTLSIVKLIATPRLCVGPSRAPPGSVRLPLERLSREAVGALGCDRVAVLLTSDLRGQQACVRLRSVYGYRDALLLLDWEQAGRAGTSRGSG